MTEESLFREALAKTDKRERSAFLHQACAGQPELRAKFEAELAGHQLSAPEAGRPTNGGADTAASDRGAPSDDATVNADPDAALETSPISNSGSSSSSMTAELPGRLEPGSGAVVAGRYILQEKIGEGGMGEVWIAKQTEPVKRNVALKVIKPGMDSRAVVQRFEHERQALAILEHPNIAKVLDGGLTPTGQPFFVMELVSGLSLTRFCDERRLTLRERLDLFVPICQAVQHAHQKGIVHRDLKPANILVVVVDGKPVPKVIDFGVAKATAGKLTDESLSTQFGAIMGTLEYMSPEQAGFSGLDIDTRADIYSLGVILYEVLTGLRPIDTTRMRNAALTEMIRVIREEEPSKPSTRLSTEPSLPSLAAVRQIEPRKLMELLKGDLDWVVMKCLEKSRDRRYESASDLARDLHRFLNGDPVEACPPSASYRLAKFARKHRVALITAGAFAVLLLAATVVSAGLAYWADRERFRATRAESKARDERDRAIKAEGQAREERDRAVNAQAKTRVEADKVKAINEFLTNDLLTQAEPENNAVEDNVTLVQVIDRAAEKVASRFAGQPEIEFAVRESLGGAYHGLSSWKKAEQQYRALRELARRPGADPAQVYRVEGNLAHVLSHRGMVDEETLAMARSSAEGLARVLGPDDPELLDARNNLAIAYLNAEKPALAVEQLEPTRKLSESKLGIDHPDTLRTRHNLACAYDAAGRTEDAIALLESTLKLMEAKLGPNHPGTIMTRSRLAGYGSRSGSEKGLALLEKTLTEQQAKLGPLHPGTIGTRNSLANAYAGAGRIKDAIAVLEVTLKYRDSKTGADSPEILNTWNNLALIYEGAGRVDESIALLETTLKRKEALLGPQHSDTIRTRLNLAKSYVQTSQSERAIPLYELSLKQNEAKLGRDHRETVAIVHDLAHALDEDRSTEAEPLFRRALEFYRTSEGPDGPLTLDLTRDLALTMDALGRHSEAQPLFRELLARRRAKSPADALALGGALSAYAWNLLAQGKWAEAEPILRECLAIREKAEPDLWTTFNARSMLGAALLGQKKYAEAEPLLHRGYEGLKQREESMAGAAKRRLTEAAERLVRLYDETGKPGEAAKLRAKLDVKKPAQPSRVPK
jgi:serine/threonine protein kinase